MKFKKIIITFILLIITIFGIFPKNTFAQDFFIEEFNSDFSNPTNWTVNNYLDRGIVTFSENNGFLTLKSNDYNFPMVSSTSDIIPEGNFDIEIAFQYLASGDKFGDGIVISELVPNYPSNPAFSNLMFYVWQDNQNHLTVGSTVCPENNPACGDQFTAYSTNVTDNSYHKLRLVGKGEKYEVYFDDDLVLTTISTSRRPNSIWLGNPKQVDQEIGWYDFEVDYIHITKLPDQILNVPFYSQNDGDWGNDTYDHAQNWIASFNTENNVNFLPNIDYFGCSMVSSAMVLNYFEIDITPNGDPLNPHYLNEWLTNKIPIPGLMGNVPGYYSNGYISWVAIQQLARYFRPNIIFDFRYQDLDYSDTEFNDFRGNINNEIPEILQMHGDPTHWWNSSSHFIVGTGYDDDNYYINDPEDQFESLPFTYPVVKRIVFYKSQNLPIHLGFAQIVVNNGVNFLLEDGQGNLAGRDNNGVVYNDIPDAHWAMESIPTGIGNSKPDFQEIIIENIATDSAYLVHVSSDQTTDFNIEMHTLNSDNSAYLNSAQGEVGPDEPKKLKITYKDSEENNITEIHQPPTFNSIRDYIREEYQNGNIKHRGLRNLLLNYLKLAERFHNRGYEKLALRFLNFEIRMVNHFSPKFIEENTANNLILMIEELRNSL
jgi:peptidase C39-like protein